MEKAIGDFQALKNLVNVFIRLGNKFGGEEPRQKSFLSPGQIFRGLQQYLATSSFNLGQAPCAPLWAETGADPGEVGVGLEEPLDKIHNALACEPLVVTEAGARAGVADKVALASNLAIRGSGMYGLSFATCRATPPPSKPSASGAAHRVGFGPGHTSPM